MPAVTPSPAEYTCQPSVHMVPAYYQPGQPGIQHSPVMYRVPTPPNTPTTSQVNKNKFIIVIIHNFINFKIELRPKIGQ